MLCTHTHARTQSKGYKYSSTIKKKKLFARHKIKIKLLHFQKKKQRFLIQQYSWTLVPTGLAPLDLAHCGCQQNRGVRN